VIAGILKGRQLKSPSWEGLRPTSDKLRETLFNVLGARVAGARVLDGYAGTGAIGIEAISRGASHVTFVDSDRRAQALIAENLRVCGIQTGYTMVRSTAERAWPALSADPGFAPFDFILLDPPYDQPAGETLAGVDIMLAPGGWVVLEHARRIAAPEHAGRLDRARDLRSGDSALAFYTCPH
jgi:16S rRNA (guanine(966)-N(2))-methyltransferase RsmD